MQDSNKRPAQTRRPAQAARQPARGQRPAQKRRPAARPSSGGSLLDKLRAAADSAFKKKQKPQAAPMNRAEQRAEKARQAKKKKVRTIFRRIGLSLLTAVVLILVAALGAGHVAFKGPSQSLADLLTVSMLETSALKFVPRIYYSKAEVEAIVERNEVGALDSETDTDMIVIAGPTPEPGSEAALQATPKPSNLLFSEDGIEIFDVQGATYNGWMMVVQDPSRVITGVCRENFSSKPGMELYEIAQRYDAVAAINGGGFSDSGGVGNGGRPIGLVISQGKLLHKSTSDEDHNTVVGFNKDNKLIIGKMSSAEAEKKGLRDALSFGPALVVNGKGAEVKGASSGLNPRTAIGQRADGAVLMLVIDGRQASSLGATYADLISVLLEYGAVNACNLDGGSSSLLYYKGEYLNRGVILTGSRKMPTGFVVR